MSHPPRTWSLRVIVQVVLFIVVVPLLPLLIAWRWDWWEAWAYAALYIVGFAVSRWLAAKRHPDLIAERARFLQHEDAKPFDRKLAPLLGIGGVLVLIVVGVDGRFGGSGAFGLGVKIASMVLLLGGYLLGSYALIENRFFSGMVRIQTDRDHHVVSSGPYRWMRHPGYAGSILAYLATPPILGSAWAFLPVAFLVVVLVVRTALEDRTLQDELPGYRDYAGQVRYRLLPGVW